MGSQARASRAALSTFLCCRHARTRKTVPARKPAQAQKRRGSVALVGCHPTFYLWRRCFLKPRPNAGAIGCRLATRAIRPAPRHTPALSLGGENRWRIASVPVCLFSSFFLLLFLLGHDKTRCDVRLQLGLDANGCKALVSSPGLGPGCRGQMQCMSCTYLGPDFMPALLLHVARGA
jgi:hypothetical protein